VSVKLPETHPHASRKKVSVWNTATQMIRDKKVIGFGLIVAGCNGILFSYLAEGAFYFIKGLGLSPRDYGLSFTVIGASAMLGGIVSKRLQHKHSSKEIMGYGLLIIAFATTIFSCLGVINHHSLAFPFYVMTAIAIISQAVCIFGTCMTSVNALVLALADYKHAIGTASSLFGFFYWCMISLFTFFMGCLHDGTLLPMPLYFLSLSCFMMIVNRICLKS
jgi:Na+/melibiose symporter-like transporter